MSGLLSLFPQIAAHDPVPGSGTMRAVRAYLPRPHSPLARSSRRHRAHVNVSAQDGHVIINETAQEMAGVDGCLQSSSLSDAGYAERIRLQYLGQLQRRGDLQAGLLHRIVADVAVHSGVSLLRRTGSPGDGPSPRLSRSSTGCAGGRRSSRTGSPRGHEWTGRLVPGRAWTTRISCPACSRPARSG